MSTDYGKLIRNIRTESGMSQQKLAESTGVSRNTIKCWENHTRNMSLTSAEKVFGALGYRIEIVEDVKNDRP